jgi:hypothetical protein
MRRPITTTEDQSTTFIELFFDLVFVYAVTQTVSLVHEELSWAGVAHAVIVFWLVWWAWTQFTWALNSADTTHPAVDAVMLAATALAFLMAVTVPDAFGDAGGWFAATYMRSGSSGLPFTAGWPGTTWPSGRPCAAWPCCRWAASPPWPPAAWSGCTWRWTAACPVSRFVPRTSGWASPTRPGRACPPLRAAGR